MLDLVRITAPASGDAGVVSLATAKKHLDVVRADQDALIQGFINAAVGHLDGAEGILGRALLPQTWELRLPFFPRCRTAREFSNGIQLPLPDLITVASLKYLDVDGVEQTLDPAAYEVLEGPAAMVIPAYATTWPSIRRHPRAVKVRYQCGFAGGVPDELQAAVKFMVGDMYAHRETAVVGLIAAEVPLSVTVKNLLRPFKVART